ncbi:MAG: pitrilysin family protein [Chthoniobacterales bacterium]
MRFSAVFVIGLTLATALSAAPPTGSIPEAFPKTKAQVRTFKNGLTVIVEEDHSAPVASVQAWCNTGSINENEWLGAGLSHILEHMLFKGTEKRKVGEIAKRIQDQGGYINAYTSFDRTVYWIDIPATGVTEALDILADAMMNATIPKEEYDKEQEVIRREFAMGFDNPERMSQEQMFSTVFRKSPYRYPVIGYLDVYNKLTRENVVAYYKERYVPNNLTFVVVGDVDAQKVFDQLDTFFSDYPRRILKPVFIPEEPRQFGRREAHKEFPTDLTRLELAWKIPGLAHSDTPALDLLAHIMGDGRSSPLYREIREKKGLAYQISSEAYTPADAGVFQVDAVTDPQNRKAVEDAVLEIVGQIKEKGVSAEALEKARRSALSAQLSAWTTMRGKASDLGSNWVLTGNLDFSKDYLNALNKVTSEDLKRVARTYLTADALSVTSLNPIGSLAEKKAITKEESKSEIQRFELSNGLRLLVREDPRLPLVSAVAVFRGGILAETSANNGITSLMARTLLKGTKTRTAEQIAQQIESVGGHITSGGGNNTFTVGVDMMRQDLTLGLDILADVIQNPTFPNAEVEREKQVQMAGIKVEEDKIITVAQNYLRQKLYGDNSYGLRASGTLKSVATLNGDDLKKFQHELAVAKNGVIAVFGSVKAGEVREIAEKAFGKMKPGELALQNVPLPKPLTAPVKQIEYRNKQQAVMMVGFLGADVLSKDFPVLELLEEASNDLSSRFFVRIREKNALAYYVGARQVPGVVPGPFFFYLGADPKKLTKAQAEFSDEISKLVNDGITEEELARAKQKFLGAEQVRNQSNAAFALSSATNELLGLGFDYNKRLKEIVTGVTLENARSVAKKYFSVPGSVEVIVEPPEKVQPSPKTN